MSNIVRVIADVKTELMQRLANKEQLRSLEREFQDLKDNGNFSTNSMLQQLE